MRSEEEAGRSELRRVVASVPRAVGYHVTMRLSDDRGIARSTPQLRRATRLMLQHGEARGLVAFRIADTHVHALIVGTREQAGRFALFAEAGLRKRLRIPVAFDRCRIRAIDSERHLANTLRYIFKQEEDHDTAFDLAHDGSSLPDLLELRVVAPWVLKRVRQLLPRLKRAAILEWLGAPNFEAIAPDVTRLADAAAAVWSLDDLRGLTAAHANARRAAVHVFDRLGNKSLSAARVLQIPMRSVTRYRAEQVPASALHAVEQQLRLRTFLQQREAAAFEGSSQD